MNSFSRIIRTIVALVSFFSLPFVSSAEQDGPSTVNGAGPGLFGAAALGTVSLDGLELGTGVFIEPDGSASGVFHVVLLGHTLLGARRNITVEGDVSAGALASGNQATFSGVATVDLGDGAPPLPDVPFSVTATSGTLVLSLGGTTLPAAGLTGAGVTIQ